MQLFSGKKDGGNPLLKRLDALQPILELSLVEDDNYKTIISTVCPGKSEKFKLSSNTESNPLTKCFEVCAYIVNHCWE